MGFLTPALLGLAAVAAVPLLLHLLQRHQGPRVVFPAVRYLQRAERESARRIRLRQLLLMLLRIGAVVLLALAAARPFAPGAGAAHEPTAVALILDNSMSTSAIDGDARVFDTLRERALEALELAGPEDRFWLVLPATPWVAARPGDAAETMARVRVVEPVTASADLGSSVERAATLLAAGADRRAMEIHVISDQQASSWRAAPGAAPAGVRVVAWLPRGAPPPNAAVTDVEIGGGLAPVAGVRAPLVARLGGARPDTVPVRLLVEDRIVAAGRGVAGSGAVLSLPAQPAGLLVGRVEIEPDALRADDRRYFAVRVAPPPTVALEGAAPFLDHGLESLAAAGRIRRGPAETATILVSAGGTGAERRPPGRDVVVMPPLAAAELPAANRALQAAGIPVRYEPLAATGQARFATDDLDPELARLLQPVGVTVHHRLAGAEAAGRVLLRLAGGEPWAVLGERDAGGRYVLLASPLEPAATELPATPAMLPLLDMLVARWLAPGLEAYEAAAGTEVPLPAAADAVEHPDGVREPVAGDRVFRIPPAAGLYRLLSGDSLLAALAVNAPPGESDLTRLDAGRLRGTLQGWSPAVASSAAEWRASIYGARLGSELWRPALLLALALLVAEMLAAAAGRARRRPVDSEPES
jgi:hypothetical protein